jgi:hypothetical protein
MAKRAVARAFVACAVLVVAVSFLPGCGGKKAVQVGGEALTMEYRLAQATPVTYRTSQSTSQTLTVMGQFMNVLTTKDLMFTLAPGEFKDGKQHLSVTIDSLEASITSPQGEFTADASSVLGKSFTMYLTGIGKEIDIIGADVIKYVMGAAGEQSIKPDFQSLFPDLAGRPLKVGDTWTTNDTLEVDQGGVKVKIVAANVNTLEGFETVAGMECARVGVVTTGTITGEGTQQGSPIAIESTSAGKDTWFFAHKGGMLAKMISETSVEGTVKVGGAQGMAIPMKQTMTTETAFVK